MNKLTLFAFLAPLILCSPPLAMEGNENGNTKSRNIERPLEPDQAKTTSKYWTDFKTGQENGSPTWLPDFSYAGISRGSGKKAYPQNRFDVTDFGAVPNDLIDDQASIEKTIQAAESAGGGIIFFPPGRFLVMTDMKQREPIKITSGNIVLKGSGSTEGGTTIHQIQPFGDKGPHDSTRMHLGKSVFSIGAETNKSTTGEDLSQEATKTYEIQQNAQAGAFTVTINDTTDFRPGDWIQLTTQNQGVMDAMLGELTVEEAWIDYHNGTKRYSEFHQIASISQRELKLSEPLFFNLEADHDWQINRYYPIANIGIEDICFMGNAYHRYVHHRSEFDDSGWSFFEMKGLVHSWIERVSFINTSQQVMLRQSAFVSLLNIFIEGNGVHHTPRIQTYNYGVLLGLMRDNSGDPHSKRAGYTHGPSIAYGSVGTVIWRVKMAHGQPIDLHSGSPYASLFDTVKGGILIGSGGGRRGFPQHLDKLVFWNFSNNFDQEQSGEKTYQYDFWKPGASNRFIKPLFVGMTGTPVTLNTNTIKDIESSGTPVAPESLYEAQLRLRSGGYSPHWIRQTQDDYQVLTEATFPSHYNPSNDNIEDLFHYPEEIHVGELIQELSTYSLEAYDSVQFSLGDWPDVTIRSDRTLMRNSIYGMMCVLYQANKNNNILSAARLISSNSQTLMIEIKSEILSEAALNLIETSPELKYIKRYLDSLNGKMRIERVNKGVAIKLLFPLAET